MNKYRNDIDGLRAIAVLAVLVFHLGYLPNGYLGVDVFFVISGYLITSIIFKKLEENTFSFKEFYVKRIRRILPLLFFITSLSLLLGLFFMLPDDLENLAQTIVASNFSVNNILMLVTSKDYWAVKNEYKPLMHTWSLGIEEQYYLIYPVFLFLISKVRLNLIKYFLGFISLLSLILFLSVDNNEIKFYLLQFRLFELSIGGLVGLLSITLLEKKFLNDHLSNISIFAIVLILLLPIVSNEIMVIAITFFTALALRAGSLLDSKQSILTRYFLQNRFLGYIGKISFSLYLWHQVIFAFSRYSYFEVIGFQESMILIIIAFFLSVLTYHFLENPFRNKNFLPDRNVIYILLTVLVISTSSALYIYFIGGIHKDFPSVGVFKKELSSENLNFFSKRDNIHIRYNEKVRGLYKSFERDEKKKILIIGNSYGRDVANIFLESSISSNIQIRYIPLRKIKKDPEIIKMWDQADVVVFAAEKFLSKSLMDSIEGAFSTSIDFEKAICFGTKNFGYSNGIHYNKIPSISSFSQYYGPLQKGTLLLEKQLKDEWGSRYVSLIAPLLNKSGNIRIFNDYGLFLSQDTVHLTKAGAIYYASILESQIKDIVHI